MNWTTKPIYQPWLNSDGSEPIKPSLTINEDGPLGEAGDFTIVRTEPFNFKAEWPMVKERTNKVPTHDPYTNPNAELYYECECGAILDPGTKSFAALNNAAMNSEWKIRWGHMYYEPFCPKCVKLKGIE